MHYIKYCRSFNEMVDVHMARIFSAIFVIVVLSSQTSHYAHADTVKGLYESKTLVASQAKEERTEALRQAFMRVLIRVSGRVDIAQSTDYPNIQEAIELATRYAQ